MCPPGGRQAQALLPMAPCSWSSGVSSHGWPAAVAGSCMSLAGQRLRERGWQAGCMSPAGYMTRASCVNLQLHPGWQQDRKGLAA